MKRLLVCMLVAAVGLTGIADAAVRRGFYKGRTSERDPLQFRVDRLKRVYSFSFTDVHLTCTDGDEFDTGTVSTPRSERFRTTRRGRFAFTARNNSAGNGYDVTGRITSPTGRGTLRVFARFGQDNQPDPNGSVVCDSGELTWNVNRQ